MRDRAKVLRGEAISPSTAPTPARRQKLIADVRSLAGGGTPWPETKARIDQVRREWRGMPADGQEAVTAARQLDEAIDAAVRRCADDLAQGKQRTLPFAEEDSSGLAAAEALGFDLTAAFDARRRHGDRALHDALAETTFSGGPWQQFAVELAAFGLAAVSALIHSGELVQRHGETQRLGRLTKQETAAVARATVVVAIRDFRQHHLIDGGWQDTDGATLASAFLATALLAFPHAVKTWEAQLRPVRRRRPTRTAGSLKYELVVDPNQRTAARFARQRLLPWRDRRDARLSQRTGGAQRPRRSTQHIG